MRIIMTGGTGLIGKPLTTALAAEGHEVVVLTRNPQQSKALAPGVRLQGWDGKSTEGWGKLVDGAGAVINLAGEGIADGRWSTARKQSIRQSRINAGNAVYSAIEQAIHKPSVLIQASAVGYYGVHQDELITEEHSPGSDFLSKVCFDWEISTAPVSKLGLRRPVLRTGIVLSNDGGAFPKMALPFRLFAGGPIGSGRQWLPWIHIADQVEAILFLLHHPNADGPFNLSAPNPLTNKAFGEVIGKVMGRPAILPVPALAMQLLLGEMATLLLDGQRAVPQRLQALGFTWQYPTADEALKQLLG